MSKFLEIALVAAMFATPAAAEAIKLGRPALPEEVAAWDIDVAPRDVGLPEGSGDVATGEELFVEKCAYCHGDFGEGVDRWPVLAGGQGSLTEPRPVKTIGSYWPYLSTVWDYVHRAMPFPEPQSLSVDELTPSRPIFSMSTTSSTRISSCRRRTSPRSSCRTKTTSMTTIATRSRCRASRSNPAWRTARKRPRS